MSLNNVYREGQQNFVKGLGTLKALIYSVSGYVCTDIHKMHTLCKRTARPHNNLSFEEPFGIQNVDGCVK